MNCFECRSARALTSLKAAAAQQCPRERPNARSGGNRQARPRSLALFRATLRGRRTPQRSDQNYTNLCGFSSVEACFQPLASLPKRQDAAATFAEV